MRLRPPPAMRPLRGLRSAAERRCDIHFGTLRFACRSINFSNPQNRPIASFGQVSRLETISRGLRDAAVCNFVQSTTSKSTRAPSSYVAAPGGTTIKPHASAAVRVSDEHWLPSGRATRPLSVASNSAKAAKWRPGFEWIEPFSVTPSRGGSTSAQPQSARTAGPTNSCNATNAAAGFPGSTASAVAPRLPNAVGFAGRSATRSNANVTPRAAAAALT